MTPQGPGEGTTLVEVGQLREWRGLRQPWGQPAPAEGMRFRVTELRDDGDVFSLYEPQGSARFNIAGREFVELYSVVVTGPLASPPMEKGGQR